MQNLRKLRRYRELRSRRDELIRRAARNGRTREQIAAASGLSEDRVKRIARQK